MAAPQRWELTHEGHHHEVVATDAGLSRRLVWRVDGAVVAEKKSSEERVRLRHGEHELALRFSMLGKGRRATLHTVAGDLSGKALAEAGVGGTDLVPEPGSPAAAYETLVREHPRLHTLRATLGGAAGIVVPLLVVWLLARVTFSLDLPLPDLPDLPDLPLPDLTSIPWPDVPLPDWSVPGWVQEVVDALTFVLPVVVAVALARAEVRRRRQQDARRSADDE